MMLRALDALVWKACRLALVMRMRWCELRRCLRSSGGHRDPYATRIQTARCWGRVTMMVVVLMVRS